MKDDVFGERGVVVASRIEIYDPNNPEKPIARITVPGEVIKEQIRKDVKIGITLKIDVGDKTKRKTFNIKVYDESIRKALENYINSLLLRVVSVTTEESVAGEYRFADIKSE